MWFTVIAINKILLFTVPVTSNASRHFKSPLAMGEMPFKIKRASSVPISVVIDTGVNSNKLDILIKRFSYIYCTYKR
mgnify:CR=1 FL=1